jgi:type IV secretion system protein VirB10
MILRPQLPFGPGLRKGVFVIGLLLVIAFFGWVMARDVSNGPDTPVQPAIQVNKTTSTVTEKLPDIWGVREKPAEASQAPAPTIPSPAPANDGLRAEIDGLRATIATLQKALQERGREQAQVPQQAPPMQARPANDDARQAAERARQAAEAARKEEKADQKGMHFWVRKKKDISADGEGTGGHSRYFLPAGWIIPISIYSEASNEAPGAILAYVREDVRDSVTGQTILIPHGTTLVGKTSGTSLFGDSRMSVEFSYMTPPRQRSIKLGGVKGSDVKGKPGFADQVNRKWGAMFASVALTSVLKGGSSALIGASTGGLGTGIDVGSSMMREGAQETSTQTTQQVRQFINTSPEISTREGYLGNLILEHPIDIPQRSLDHASLE